MFADRADAGRRLARELQRLTDLTDTVVVGLPRGGVPVAAEVAAALGAPLDVIVVRKLGLPTHPELAMGAIGEGGVSVLDQQVMRLAAVDPAELAAVEAAEGAELDRRARVFRRDLPRTSLRDKTVIVVDDGVATGSTARAACDVARAEGARSIVLAVPVAPPDWEERMAGAADRFVAVETPSGFRAVGQFYRRFAQTTDAEVIDALVSASRRAHPPRPGI